MSDDERVVSDDEREAAAWEDHPPTAHDEDVPYEGNGSRDRDPGRASLRDAMEAAAGERNDPQYAPRSLEECEQDWGHYREVLRRRPRDGSILSASRGPAVPIYPRVTKVGLRDLADIVRGDIEPEMPAWGRAGTHPGLVIPRCYHDLHGEPGVGKTWVGLALAKDALRTGHSVLYLDWEGTAKRFVARMLALGVPPDELAAPQRLRYANPAGPWGDAEWDELAEVNVYLSGVALVVLDSVGRSIASEALEENANRDVNIWYERIVAPFLAMGSAVLGIDHVPKGADRARGARGASAKLGNVDVSYEVLPGRPFSSRTAGYVRIKVAKDRIGPIGGIGEIVQHVAFEPGEDGLAVSFRDPPVSTDEHGHFRPTVLMERVSRYIEDQTAQGFEASTREVRSAVFGKTTYIHAALGRLVDEGYISIREWRNSDLYTSIRPFREETD